MHHEDFKNDDDTYIELYAVKRYWKVHREGDSDNFFDAQAPSNEQEDDEEQRLLPGAIGVHLSGEARTTETIIALRDEVDVDDDNELAPENVPEQVPFGWHEGTMSHTWFELILQHIKYTKHNPPTYKDILRNVLSLQAVAILE